MKFLLVLLLAYAQSPEETAAPAAKPALKKADVLFLRKTKEFAKLTIEDNQSGIKSVFSTDHLDKGTFVIKIVDSCVSKKTIAVVGEFFTSSGMTSSEFNNEGLSVGQRNNSIENKFVTLSKKLKSGKPTQLGCAVIKAAE